jgi:nitrite reductase/ring-hydroxylating ferredoxin subunit
MASSSDLTERRRFLKMISAASGACMLASMGVACGSDEEKNVGQKPASGPIKAGNVKDLAVDTLKLVGAGVPVLIARDDEGVYAMNAICTHQQCNIATDGKVTDDEIECECHGSRFDKNGAVLEGPATKALEHYVVEIATDGAITVQAGTTTAATTRVAVA